jgi:hypothetical protein
MLDKHVCLRGPVGKVVGKAQTEQTHSLTQTSQHDEAKHNVGQSAHTSRFLHIPFNHQTSQ